MAKERKTYPGGLVRGAAIPSISFPQFQVVQSGMDSLNNKLNQLNNFALKKVDKEMEDAGIKYAAENPISTDQFLDANPDEKNKMLKGKKGTTYGDAIRATQLSLLTSQITMKASNDFANLKTLAYAKDMDLETFTTELNAIVNGYSDSLLEVDGEASIVANAKLATTANTYLTSYSDKLLKDYKNMKDATVLIYSNQSIELIADIVKGGAEQSINGPDNKPLMGEDGKQIKLSLDDILKLRKEEKQQELIVNGISKSDLLAWSKDWDARVIREKANFLFSDDFARSRAPDRVGTSIFARTLYKFFPLSGGLRYLSRVEMDEHKQLLTLSDRLKVLMPQIVDKNSIMPRRNMFGEVINRKNGWLFGLGKRSGLWSSPFAMTEFKYPEISKFFEGRDFDYRPPDKIDRKSGIDLRDIKNKETGQTAYDRMRELVGTVKIRYEDGKEYTLKEIVEKLVMDKKSQLYRLPDNKVLGEDMRQNLILNYVNAAENIAKSMILKEFPQIVQERIKRGNFKQNEVEKANSALNVLLGL